MLLRVTSCHALSAAAREHRLSPDRPAVAYFATDASPDHGRALVRAWLTKHRGNNMQGTVRSLARPQRTAGTVALVVFIVGMISLGGCASTSAAEFSLKPDPPAGVAPSETPPAAEAPVAGPTPAVGTLVDEATAKSIRQNFEGDTKVYTLPDGTNMVISRAEPLPEPVKAAIGTKLTAAAATDLVGRPANVNKVRDQAVYETGHLLVLVVRINTYDASGEKSSAGMYWKSLNDINPGESHLEQGPALAEAQAFAASAGPNWEVIVSQ